MLGDAAGDCYTGAAAFGRITKNWRGGRSRWRAIAVCYRSSQNCPQPRRLLVSSGMSFDTKQRIKQAIDIADLIGSYLPLRREGRGFKANCPWHDDTRPSLQVNPERQSFKCWVCDIGGDIFSFVMKIEGVGFPEALAMLADRANISLTPAGRGERPAPVDEKRVLYQAMAWADEQYHACLL